MNYEEKIKNLNETVLEYTKEQEALEEKINLNNIKLTNLKQAKQKIYDITLKSVIKVLLISGGIIGLCKLGSFNPNIIGVCSVITLFNLPTYLKNIYPHRRFIRNNNKETIIGNNVFLKGKLEEFEVRKNYHIKYAKMLEERANENYSCNLDNNFYNNNETTNYEKKMVRQRHI